MSQISSWPTNPMVGTPRWLQLSDQKTPWFEADNGCSLGGWAQGSSLPQVVLVERPLQSGNHPNMAINLQDLAAHFSGAYIYWNKGDGQWSLPKKSFLDKAGIRP